MVGNTNNSSYSSEYKLNNGGNTINGNNNFYNNLQNQNFQQQQNGQFPFTNNSMSMPNQMNQAQMNQAQMNNYNNMLNYMMMCVPTNPLSNPNTPNTNITYNPMMQNFNANNMQSNYTGNSSFPAINPFQPPNKK